jgi:DNA polymerase I-like protein with 3'-5' exonuclease and polymerase domains
METSGWKFDVQYYKETVIPLMERRMWEAEDRCASFKQFLIKREPGDHELVYFWEGTEDLQEDFKLKCKRLKHLIKTIFGKQTTMKELSVRARNAGGRKEIRISWTNGPEDPSVRSLVSSFCGMNKMDLEYKSERVINFLSRNLMQKQLGKIIRRKVDNSRAKYLKTLIDPDDPRTKAVEYVLQFMQARSYFAKYGRNMLKHVQPDGYIYMTWNQIGGEANEIVSGRSSSKEPNIMQMAARDLLYAWSSEGGINAGELLRTAWIAEDGCVILDCDVSNFEPRITTQITKDKNLIRIFRDNLDMHMMTGMAILRLEQEPEKGTPEYDYVRNTVGKIVNLGLSYGMGAKGLAEFLYQKTNGQIDWRSDSQIHNAKNAISAYFELYPGILACIEETEYRTTRRLRESGNLADFRGRKIIGVVQSDALGRPRRFCPLLDHEKKDLFTREMLSYDYNPTIGTDNEKPYYYNECKRRINKIRLAGYNHRIQSSQADLMKLAELYIWEELQKKYASGEFDPALDRPCAVVHDEFVAQAQYKNAAEMARIIHSCMIRAAKTFIKIIPVKASIGCGRNWFEAKSSDDFNLDTDAIELSTKRVVKNIKRLRRGQEMERKAA